MKTTTGIKILCVITVLMMGAFTKYREGGPSTKSNFPIESLAKRMKMHPQKKRVKGSNMSIIRLTEDNSSEIQIFKGGGL